MKFKDLAIRTPFRFFCRSFVKWGTSMAEDVERERDAHVFQDEADVEAEAGQGGN
jgi:hypothetical protein